MCWQVKEYVQRQWTKILAGRVSLADFVFAKEVRLGTYSARHGIVPPAAIVAGKAMASDPRMEPRYGERVPYVVVYGEPGAPVMLQDLSWLRCYSLSCRAWKSCVGPGMPDIISYLPSIGTPPHMNIRISTF